MTIPTPPNPPPTYTKNENGFHCSNCKRKITISRTLHNFRYHRLCCVRGEGTENANESDFDNDSEFEGCGGTEFNHHDTACKCVYDDTKLARWPKVNWQSGPAAKIENSVLQRHNADYKGQKSIPSQTRGPTHRKIQAQKKQKHKLEEDEHREEFEEQYQQVMTENMKLNEQRSELLVGNSELKAGNRELEAENRELQAENRSLRQRIQDGVDRYENLDAEFRELQRRTTIFPSTTSVQSQPLSNYKF